MSTQINCVLVCFICKCKLLYLFNDTPIRLWTVLVLVEYLVAGSEHFLDHVKRVKRHVSSNQGSRINRHDVLPPIQN
jgi:hypothetical protein